MLTSSNLFLETSLQRRMFSAKCVYYQCTDRCVGKQRQRKGKSDTDKTRDDVSTYWEIGSWQPWHVGADCRLRSEQSCAVQLGTYQCILSWQFSTHDDITDVTQPIHMLQVTSVRVNFYVKVCLQVIQYR